MSHNIKHFSTQLKKEDSLFLETKNNETIQLKFVGMKSNHMAQIDLYLNESIKIQKPKINKRKIIDL